MSRLNTLASSPPLGSQTNLRESGDLRSQGECMCPPLTATLLSPSGSQHLPPSPWSLMRLSLVL